MSDCPTCGQTIDPAYAAKLRQELEATREQHKFTSNVLEAERKRVAAERARLAEERKQEQFALRLAPSRLGLGPVLQVRLCRDVVPLARLVGAATAAKSRARWRSWRSLATRSAPGALRRLGSTTPTPSSKRGRRVALRGLAGSTPEAA